MGLSGDDKNGCLVHGRLLVHEAGLWSGEGMGDAETLTRS